MPDYAAIIEREFRARMELNEPDDIVRVDMSQDEVIIVDVCVAHGCTTYTCTCNSDEEFYFDSTEGDFRFPIPADYLE